LTDFSKLFFSLSFCSSSDGVSTIALIGAASESSSLAYSIFPLALVGAYNFYYDNEMLVVSDNADKNISIDYGVDS
jgi:hypothetical protein